MDELMQVVKWYNLGLEPGEHFMYPMIKVEGIAIIDMESGAEVALYSNVNDVVQWFRER